MFCAVIFSVRVFLLFVCTATVYSPGVRPSLAGERSEDMPIYCAHTHATQDLRIFFNFLAFYDVYLTLPCESSEGPHFVSVGTSVWEGVSSEGP